MKSWNLRSIEDRLWSRVKKTDGCWEWLGPTAGKGYGSLRHKSRQQYAHRVSYELAYGPIPNGLCVCHHCDNPRCVRPDHLFIGTVKENNQDMYRKGRATPHGLVGERHHKAKLTWAIVRDLRSRDMSARGSVMAAAREFGVRRDAIHRVLSGSGWKEENT